MNLLLYEMAMIWTGTARIEMESGLIQICFSGVMIGKNQGWLLEFLIKKVN